MPSDIDQLELNEFMEKVDQCTDLSENFQGFKKCFDFDRKERKIKVIQKEYNIPKEDWDKNFDYYEYEFRKRIK